MDGCACHDGKVQPAGPCLHLPSDGVVHATQRACACLATRLHAPMHATPCNTTSHAATHRVPAVHLRPPKGTQAQPAPHQRLFQA